jgi:uncharacterized protein YjbI with pentapeptide repeats
VDTGSYDLDAGTTYMENVNYQRNAYTFAIKDATNNVTEIGSDYVTQTFENSKYVYNLELTRFATDTAGFDISALDGTYSIQVLNGNYTSQTIPQQVFLKDQYPNQGSTRIIKTNFKMQLAETSNSRQIVSLKAYQDVNFFTRTFYQQPADTTTVNTVNSPYLSIGNYQDYKANDNETKVNFLMANPIAGITNNLYKIYYQYSTENDFSENASPVIEETEVSSGIINDGNKNIRFPVSNNTGYYKVVLKYVDSQAIEHIMGQSGADTSKVMHMEYEYRTNDLSYTFEGNFHHLTPVKLPIQFSSSVNSNEIDFTNRYNLILHYKKDDGSITEVLVDPSYIEIDTSTDVYTVNLESVKNNSAKVTQLDNLMSFELFNKNHIETDPVEDLVTDTYNRISYGKTSEISVRDMEDIKFNFFNRILFKQPELSDVLNTLNNPYLGVSNYLDFSSEDANKVDIMQQNVLNPSQKLYKIYYQLDTGSGFGGEQHVDWSNIEDDGISPYNKNIQFQVTNTGKYKIIIKYVDALDQEHVVGNVGTTTKSLDIPEIFKLHKFNYTFSVNYHDLTPILFTFISETEIDFDHYSLILVQDGVTITVPSDMTGSPPIVDMEVIQDNPVKYKYSINLEEMKTQGHITYIDADYNLELINKNYLYDIFNLPDNKNLDYENLENVDFTGISLNDFSMKFANLNGITCESMKNADLEGAKLTNATLVNTNLQNAVLKNANLRNTDLTGADLTGADLSGADLTDVALTGAKLINADLTGANLTNVNMIDVDVQNATMKNLVLTNTRLIFAKNAPGEFSVNSLTSIGNNGPDFFKLIYQAFDPSDINTLGGGMYNNSFLEAFAPITPYAIYVKNNSEDVYAYVQYQSGTFGWSQWKWCYYGTPDSGYENDYLHYKSNSELTVNQDWTLVYMSNYISSTMKNTINNSNYDKTRTMNFIILMHLNQSGFPDTPYNPVQSLISYGRNQDYTGFNFSNLIFKNIDFTGSKFENCILNSTRFENCTLDNCNLSSADLTNAVFLNSTLNELTGTAPTSLPTGYLFIVNSLNTKYMVGPGTNYQNVDISGVDLSGVSFTNASTKNIPSSTPPSALPQGYSFVVNSNGIGFIMHANINLDNSNLSGIDLSSTDITNMSLMNLTGAPSAVPAGYLSLTNSNNITFVIKSGGTYNFDGMDLSGIDLSSIDISKMSFVNLTGLPTAIPATHTFENNSVISLFRINNDHKYLLDNSVGNLPNQSPTSSTSTYTEYDFKVVTNATDATLNILYQDSDSNNEVKFNDQTLNNYIKLDNKVNCTYDTSNGDFNGTGGDSSTYSIRADSKSFISNKQGISGFSFTNSSITNTYFVGLGLANSDWSTMNYAVQCDTTTFKVFENGSEVFTQANAVSGGDVIEAYLNCNNKMLYFLNGDLLYTSTQEPSLSLYLNISGKGGNDLLFTNLEWKQVKPGDIVKLTGIANINYDGLTGQIIKNSGSAGWNAGAHSLHSISEKDQLIGGVSWIYSNNTKNIRVGLSTRNSSDMDLVQFNSDFGIYCEAYTGEAEVYESGTKKLVRELNTGDKCKICLTLDNQIVYAINDTIIYTSTVTPTFPLWVDFVVYNVPSTDVIASQLKWTSQGQVSGTQLLTSNLYTAKIASSGISVDNNVKILNMDTIDRVWLDVNSRSNVKALIQSNFVNDTDSGRAIGLDEHNFYSSSAGSRLNDELIVSGSQYNWETSKFQEYNYGNSVYFGSSGIYSNSNGYISSSDLMSFWTSSQPKLTVEFWNKTKYNLTDFPQMSISWSGAVSSKPDNVSLTNNKISIVNLKSGDTEPARLSYFQIHMHWQARSNGIQNFVIQYSDDDSTWNNYFIDNNYYNSSDNQTTIANYAWTTTSATTNYYYFNLDTSIDYTTNIPGTFYGDKNVFAKYWRLVTGSSVNISGPQLTKVEFESYNTANTTNMFEIKDGETNILSLSKTGLTGSNSLNESWTPATLGEQHQYTHYAVCFDNSNLKVFRNGNLVKDASWSFAVPATNNYTFKIQAPEDNFDIIKITNDNVYSETFDPYFENGPVVSQWYGKNEDPIMTSKELMRYCFNDVNLSGQDFTGANLSYAKFKDCDLTGADFSGANTDLNGATFTDCNLTNARFVGTDRSVGTFVNCNQTGIVLSRQEDYRSASDTITHSYSRIKYADTDVRKVEDMEHIKLNFNTRLYYDNGKTITAYDTTTNISTGANNHPYIHISPNNSNMNLNEMITIDNTKRIYKISYKYGSDLPTMKASTKTLVDWSDIVTDNPGTGIMFQVTATGYYMVIIEYTNTMDITRVVGNTPNDVFTEIIHVEKDYEKIELSYEYPLTTADESTPNSNTEFYNKYSYVIFLSSTNILPKIEDGTYLLSVEEPNKAQLMLYSPSMTEFINNSSDDFLVNELNTDSNYLGPVTIGGEQKYRNVINWSRLVKHYKTRGFQLPPVGAFTFKLYNANYVSNPIAPDLSISNKEINQSNLRIEYTTPSFSIAYKDIKILFEEILPVGQDQVKCNLYFDKDSLSGNPYYLVFQSLRHIFLEDDINWARSPGHCWRMNKAHNDPEWFLKSESDTSPFLNVNPKDTSAYKKCYKFNYVGEIKKLGDEGGDADAETSRIFSFRDVYNKLINVTITNKVVADTSLENNLVAYNSAQLQIEKQDTIVDPVIQNATLGQNNVDFFKLHIEFAARFIFNQNVNVKQLFDRSIEITHYLDPSDKQVLRIGNDDIEEHQDFTGGPSLKIGHKDTDGDQVSNLIKLNDSVLKSWLIGIKNNESKTFNLTMTLRYSYVSGFGDARKTIAINRVFEKSFSYVVRKNLDGVTADVVEQPINSFKSRNTRNVAIGVVGLVALALMMNRAKHFKT